MKNLILIASLFASSFIYAQETVISYIIIEVNKKTKAAVLSKLISTKKGKVLDSIQIEKDVKLLKRLPSIANASYQVQEKEAGYEVTYKIEENFTIIPSAYIYTTNDDEFAFRLGLYEFNALGRNITLGAIFQQDI